MGQLLNSIGSDQLGQLFGSGNGTQSAVPTQNISADGIDHDAAQVGSLTGMTANTSAGAGQRSLGTGGIMPFQLPAGQGLVTAGNSTATNSGAAPSSAVASSNGMASDSSISGLLQALFPQAGSGVMSPTSPVSSASGTNSGLVALLGNLFGGAV